jgi:hypothetical protein
MYTLNQEMLDPKAAKLDYCDDNDLDPDFTIKKEKNTNESSS